MAQTNWRINQKNLRDIISKFLISDDYHPLFIWGKPGIGKSDIIKQAAKEIGYRVIDIRLQLMGPLDLQGIPFYDQKSGTAVFAPPRVLPRQDDMGNIILLLDELPTAPRAVQASALQLILDRGIGEYRLPPNVKIIAAGNDVEDNMASHDMIGPLANRFIHLDMYAEFAHWFDWAQQVDTRGKTKRQRVHPNIVEFLLYNAGHFMYDREKIGRGAKAFPTPRSWVFASDAMYAYIADPIIAPDNFYDNFGEENSDAIDAFNAKRLEHYKFFVDNEEVLAILEGAVGSESALAFNEHARMVAEGNLDVGDPRKFFAEAFSDIDTVVDSIVKMAEKRPDVMTNYFDTITVLAASHVNTFDDEDEIEIAEGKNKQAIRAEKAQNLINMFIMFLQKIRNKIKPEIRKTLIAGITKELFEHNKNLIEAEVADAWTELSAQ